MIKLKAALVIATATAAAAAVLIPGTGAWATTVPSPIGSITAEQYQGTSCDDFGANIKIGVAGGLPNTTYSATYTAFSVSDPSTYYEQVTTTFNADAAGNGSFVALNTRTPDGRSIGTSSATVTAAGTTVTVDFPIYCRGNQGD
jgi:hypothetical protein